MKITQEMGGTVSFHLKAGRGRSHPTRYDICVKGRVGTVGHQRRGRCVTLLIPEHRRAIYKSHTGGGNMPA